MTESKLSSTASWATGSAGGMLRNFPAPQLNPTLFSVLKQEQHPMVVVMTMRRSCGRKATISLPYADGRP